VLVANINTTHVNYHQHLPSPNPAMATLEDLDAEITDYHTQISILRAHRANLSTILLSQPHLPALLEQRPVRQERKRRSAAKLVEAQLKRNLENVYRACAGVTAYKVKDPDPCAVDNGNVLGVRVEVSIGGRFVDTYHVLFNRPDERKRNVLKIHKHTIPPCIPLQPLANRWLPKATKDADATMEQNLIKFGRSLRKELVSWHLRQNALEKLRAEAGIVKDAMEQGYEKGKAGIGQVVNAFVSDDEDEEEEEGVQSARVGPVKITDIEGDAAVREVTITWSNGNTGVVKVTKDGNVDMAIFRSRDGIRDPALGRKAIGRMEGLVQRLTA
jgi:central kinetochore subunit Mal2/MCM21